MARTNVTTMSHTTPHTGVTHSDTVQDLFLQHLREHGHPVTIFLVNGVKLQGVIPQFDDETIILRRDGHTQLVYKHAVSTIMPVAPLSLYVQDGDASL